MSTLHLNKLKEKSILAPMSFAFSENTITTNGARGKRERANEIEHKGQEQTAT